MAETSDEIVEHIESRRDRLGDNINELEAYVREKADLRGHYVKRPWAFLGSAALGGLLLASMILPDGSGRRRKHHTPKYQNW
jgi:hypothetical protein